MKKGILIFLCLFLMISCNDNKIEKVENSIAFAYGVAFSEIGKNVTAKVTVENNKLLVKLYIEAPSFIDAESQKLMLSYVGYKMYEELKEFELTEYIYVNEGFEHDPLQYKVNRNNLKYVYEKLDNNIIFRRVIIYLLNSISSDEIIFANITIHELYKLIPDKFNFNESFWELLQMHTLNNSVESKYNKYYDIFKWAIKVDSIKFDSQHIVEIDKIVDEYSKK